MCHDDQLDGRRIAFILYLNREWKDNYGGALELFDVDDTGTSPDKIVRRIMPRFNTLAFFEVRWVWICVLRCMIAIIRIAINNQYIISTILIPQ